MSINRLKLLRKKNNLTQKYISNMLGISQTQYCLYESGKQIVPVSILSKLAKIYNTSIDFLIGDTNEITPHTKINS